MADSAAYSLPSPSVLAHTSAAPFVTVTKSTLDGSLPITRHLVIHAPLL